MSLLIDNQEFSTISGYLNALIDSKIQLASNIEQTGIWLKSNYGQMISNSNTSLSGLFSTFSSTFTSTSHLSWTGTNITVNMLGPIYQSINLSGNTTFHLSNLDYGRNIYLKIARQTGALVTMGFPADFTWLGSGSKPPSLATSKTGLLKLISYSNTYNGVLAEWVAQK